MPATSHRAPAGAPAPDGREFCADAITANNESEAETALEETYDAIDEFLRQRARDNARDVPEVSLCMENEHDRFAVEES
jgi:NH3-dependent NAD+ synthetase